MGQYYYPTILREKNKRFYSEEFYSHDYDNGLKLTEHSYCGNNFVETIMAQLLNKPGRLAWIGDYHSDGDFAELNPDLPEIIEKKFYAHYKCFTSSGNEDYCKGKHVRYYNKPEEVKERQGRFILNHDKQCYIDMEEYEKNNLTCTEDDNWHFHPIPLLTAVGNGRGGGDFHGIGEEDVGCWAGDLLVARNVRPNGYENVTKDFQFQGKYC